jgi:hypothetical protein
MHAEPVSHLLYRKHPSVAQTIVTASQTVMFAQTGHNSLMIGDSFAGSQTAFVQDAGNLSWRVAVQ